ncbi:hypothetical protein MRX96_028788 [Rhipicephalus microplus]
MKTAINSKQLSLRFNSNDDVSCHNVQLDFHQLCELRLLFISSSLLCSEPDDERSICLLISYRMIDAAIAVFKLSTPLFAGTCTLAPSQSTASLWAWRLSPCVSPPTTRTLGTLAYLTAVYS